MEAVKWGTDYHIKAHSEPFVLYGVVRTAAEERGVRWKHRPLLLAAAGGHDDEPPGLPHRRQPSMVFRHSNPAYSYQLLSHAKQYRGKYDGGITVARRYYRSYSGYGVFFSLLPLTVSDTYMYHSIIAHTLCLAVSPTTREGSSTCASAREVPWQGSTQRSEDHRRPIVPAAVEQHAVRHQSRLPTHHLLRLYYISRKKRSLCRWNRIAC
ncbi:hypothetical protein GW17_00044950 [Ensete ventricosum]|nr:hypothetical protein GW17_00044950 [Ensete ventricosum]